MANDKKNLSINDADLENVTGGATVTLEYEYEIGAKVEIKNIFATPAEFERPESYIGVIIGYSISVAYGIGELMYEVKAPLVGNPEDVVVSVSKREIIRQIS